MNHETTHRQLPWLPKEIPQRPAQPKNTGYIWLRYSLFLPAFPTIRERGGARRDCICREYDCHARVHNSHHHTYNMLDQGHADFLPCPIGHYSAHGSCRDVGRRLSLEFFITFTIRNICLYFPNSPSTQPHTLSCRQSKRLSWTDRAWRRRKSP